MSTKIVNVSLFCIPWSFIIVCAQLEVSLPAPCSDLPMGELFTWKTSNNGRAPHAWPCHCYISYLQTLATNRRAHPRVWQLDAFASSLQRPQTIRTEELITSLKAAYKTEERHVTASPIEGCLCCVKYRKDRKCSLRQSQQVFVKWYAQVYHRNKILLKYGKLYWHIKTELMKLRTRSRNACYHSVQNRLSPISYGSPWRLKCTQM
jgi:hypothetical protein